MLAERLVDIAHGAAPKEIAVTLAFTTRAAAHFQEPVLRPLLPLDPTMVAGLADAPWDSRALPDFNLNPADLLAALVNEHLFASLYRASAEAMVTENAARLALMQQAERSIDDRIEALKAETRTVRQSEITTELLDVIAGFEALRTRQSPKLPQGNEPTPSQTERKETT